MSNLKNFWDLQNLLNYYGSSYINYLGIKWITQTPE